MNTMHYKGYAARIGFDERDNIFVGRVLDVSSIISFHGKTIDELRAEFEKVVDDTEVSETLCVPGVGDTR